MTEHNEDDKFDIARIVILSGWILTIVACAAVIITALLQEAPTSPIKDWAATCLGFLFGSFASMVKDFIKF
jgi:hypothetical protein